MWGSFRKAGGSFFSCFLVSSIHIYILSEKEKKWTEVKFDQISWLNVSSHVKLTCVLDAGQRKTIDVSMQNQQDLGFMPTGRPITPNVMYLPMQIATPRNSWQFLQGSMTRLAEQVRIFKVWQHVRCLVVHEVTNPYHFKSMRFQSLKLKPKYQCLSTPIRIIYLF